MKTPAKYFGLAVGP